MKTNSQKINIIKASGLKVPFDKEKLKQSLLRSGANSELTDFVANEIMETLVEGTSTRTIYKTAFRLLKNESKPIASRYKLKQAIIELGPSGFPFEQFIGELMRFYGYSIDVGVLVDGQCVKHEIDVIAQKDNQHFMVECKFHNRQGYISDVKVPLYIQSRFVDVEKQWKRSDGHDHKFHQAWIVTNTRFSEDAIQYARCSGIRLIGWDYPHQAGLKDMIDSSGLHPVTCLTSLTQQEKQQLLDRKIVLCKSLSHNYGLLQNLGIAHQRLQRILNECAELCQLFLKNHVHDKTIHQ